MVIRDVRLQGSGLLGSKDESDNESDLSNHSSFNGDDNNNDKAILTRLENNESLLDFIKIINNEG